MKHAKEKAKQEIFEAAVIASNRIGKSLTELTKKFSEVIDALENSTNKVYKKNSARKEKNKVNHHAHEKTPKMRK